MHGFCFIRRAAREVDLASALFADWAASTGVQAAELKSMLDKVKNQNKATVKKVLIEVCCGETSK